MKNCKFSLLVFCISFFCFLLVSNQACRWHNHTKQKYSHKQSHISPPPCSPPDPTTPPEDPPTKPYHSSGIFDVRSFGAVGDGQTDDTAAFKMAWDTACQSDESAARILVPQGFSFMIQSTIFTGPCLGGLVLQLFSESPQYQTRPEKVDGTLVPPDGPGSWPKYISRHQWLVFYRINEMSLQGGGVIDGRGLKWWNLPCKPHRGINGTTLPGPCDSPIAIRFFMSSNLTVQGLRIKNSPQFHFRFDSFRNVHIESISISSPAKSPNTDGIHIEKTHDVQIYHSVISNGDDCVSIGSGCYDVNIRNLTCGPGHGISIGSLGNHNSRACVSNITVRDSIMKGTDNGVRIKTWQGGSGSVSGVTFSNIHMDNVRNPTSLRLFSGDPNTLRLFSGHSSSILSCPMTHPHYVSSAATHSCSISFPKIQPTRQNWVLKFLEIRARERSQDWNFEVLCSELKFFSLIEPESPLIFGDAPTTPLFCGDPNPGYPIPISCDPPITFFYSDCDRRPPLWTTAMIATYHHQFGQSLAPFDL